MEQHIHVSVRVKPLSEGEDSEWEIINNCEIQSLRTKERFAFGKKLQK